jgi:hypothetical protein
VDRHALLAKQEEVNCRAIHNPDFAELPGPQSCGKNPSAMGILSLSNRNDTAWAALGNAMASVHSAIKETRTGGLKASTRKCRPSGYMPAMPPASAGYVACEASLDSSDCCQPGSHEMLQAGIPATAACLLKHVVF